MSHCVLNLFLRTNVNLTAKYKVVFVFIIELLFLSLRGRLYDKNNICLVLQSFENVSLDVSLCLSVIRFQYSNMEVLITYMKRNHKYHF